MYRGGKGEVRLINFPVNVVTFAGRKEAHCTEIPTNYTAVNYQLGRLRDLYLKKIFFLLLVNCHARDGVKHETEKIDLTAVWRMATVEKRSRTRSVAFIDQPEREREREGQGGEKAGRGQKDLGRGRARELSGTKLRVDGYRCR